MGLFGGFGSGDGRMGNHGGSQIRVSQGFWYEIYRLEVDTLSPADEEKNTAKAEFARCWQSATASASNRVVTLTPRAAAYATSSHGAFENHYQIWDGQGREGATFTRVAKRLMRVLSNPLGAVSARGPKYYGDDSGYGDDYTHFILLPNGEVESGWEYAEDAQDRKKELKEEGQPNARVFTRGRVPKDALAKFFHMNK